ncbi:MAG: tRNA uridine(34) 5-carboxymethylaminomethyl modification radical SAM/GNAT enzyme Elp3, partial [Candidatus Undinarchaeales archaeon]|nr:tRNA uridine(34) 5-carboxymethylaminomethyl modification radical SAM/GNAT enzyme Elp3 [Candidatus Undinarchaeales archaeon]
VMSAPAPCPHGTCSYCPRGEKAPQSYTGHEPAAMRAIAHGFDPFDQTDTRVRQLERTGHSTDKVELIIMGGTFPARPPAEQEHFVHRCLDALNGEDSPTLEE